MPGLSRAFFIPGVVCGQSAGSKFSAMPLMQ